MDCHTSWQAGGSPPLATNRLFAGGRGFSAADWSAATDGGAPVLYSPNLTPSPDGIKDWAAKTVANALKHGTDDQGVGICRPMPSGPAGSFGGLTDADALDIGWYLVTIPPIASGDIPGCGSGVGDDAGDDGGVADAPSE
jgi:hypothetical protein